MPPLRPTIFGGRLRQRDQHWVRLLAALFFTSILAAPPVPAAQTPSKVARIGYLVTGSLDSPDMAMRFNAFRQGLSEHGYTEGRNIIIDYRTANGKIERLPGLAAELTRLKVDLIVAIATPAARAAQQATSTIPIVVTAMGEPVRDGLVASLARPGGNITGTTFLGPELVPKRMELLKEAVPKIARIGGLWHAGAFGEQTTKEMLNEAQSAARSLGVQLHLVSVQGPGDLASAFSALIKERADALIVFPSTMLFSEHRRIVELAAKHRLPAVYNARESVQSGGLLAYGANLTELNRHSAVYVVKILKGTKPAELPVEQPTRFELSINLKTAKTLGVIIPQSVLFRADHVIQ